MAPAWIRKVARHFVVDVKWEIWAHGMDVAPETIPPSRGPRGHWIDPLKLILEATPKATRWMSSARAAGALRSTIIGGQWSQQRFASCQFTGASDCIICNDDVRGAQHQVLALPQQERHAG